MQIKKGNLMLTLEVGQALDFYLPACRGMVENKPGGM